MLKLTVTNEGARKKETSTIARQKLGKRSRTKGSNYERSIAAKFKEAYNVDLVRTPQSGGFAKKSSKADQFRGDVVPADASITLRLHIECKNTKSWTLPAWIKQAEADCPVSSVPVVVFHQHGTSKDYVCIGLEDFFKVVPENAIITRK